MIERQRISERIRRRQRKHMKGRGGERENPDLITRIEGKIKKKMKKNYAYTDDREESWG